MSVGNPAFDPTLDFTGLFADQTEDVILSRMISWANEGLDPIADADRWEDTREGSHWRIGLMPAVREIARVYDVMGTEVPMAAFVLWAWGTYLDDLAAAYSVQRNPAIPATGVVTFTGPVGTDIPQGTTEGVAPSSETDTPPTFATLIDGVIPVSGSIDLPVQATVGGVAGNVAASAITVPAGPLPPGVTFTNATATGGGADPETDDSLRERVLQAIAGQGPGNQQDYLRWARGFPGVSVATVVPVWNGAGTVLVMVTDPTGRPLPAGVVNGLQTELDPVAGKGSGIAPVGATVTVNTSTALNVAADVTLTYLPGYSWSGTGNTIAVGPTITAAVAAYLLSIKPGGTIRNGHVLGIFATAAGVDTASALSFNAGAVGADLAVGLSPPQAPILTGITVH